MFGYATHFMRGTSAMPILTLFCGLPGAGKTTLAKRLEAAGAGVRICTDDVQAGLGVAQTLSSTIGSRWSCTGWRWLCSTRTSASSLKTGSGRAQSGRRSSPTPGSGGARIVFHVFDLPREVLWARLKERQAQALAGAHVMSEAELDWACQIFEPPTASELTEIDEAHIHGRPSREL
ncbi:MAG: ATP-binding protein [Ornithinimicrobium sp.]